MALQVSDNAGPCPATHEGPTLSTSARPSTASASSLHPHSTFSTTDLTRLTVPQSAATTPATIHSSSQATFAPKSPLPATLHTSNSPYRNSNETMLLAKDRLAEEIVRHAKTEELILKERKLHRKAERARLEACYALEKKNAELEAALLDLQTTTDFLNFEALQKSLVRLGIVYPTINICAAARRSITPKEGPEQKQKLKLAKVAYQAFDVSDDGDSCSEPVSEEPPMAL
ncbi:hypothetical protein FRC04_009757 [Tulasnella sp. 424]|nr:hypothetical protein FRC04_009757 [Tulasnella sp. 424]